MTALVANKASLPKVGRTQAYPVKAGAHIFKGALVMVGADGYLIPGADTASCVFVGVAGAEANNTAGQNGDISCLVRKSGDFSEAGSDITQAWVGQTLYLVDDATVALTGGVSHHIACGVCVAAQQFDAPCRVRIDNIT